MPSIQEKLTSQIQAAVTGKAAPVEKTVEELAKEKKMELLSKVRQMREDTINQKGKVWPSNPDNPPSEKVFVWANSNEHRVVAYKSEGYTIVQDGTTRIRTNWVREDGTHRYGDLILMEIDKDLWEMIKLDEQIRAVENAEGQSMFEAFASESGIPVHRLSA
jgi:hypothetical protein